jgi:hypothetical protein
MMRLRPAARACALALLAFGQACKERATPDALLDAGAARGCRDNSACASTEYCEHDRGLCGRGARSGTCRPKPAGCASSYAPVCGCDGTVYANECSARAAGVDLATLGGCSVVIPDWAACGKHYCDARTSYCEIYLSDVVDPPTDYFCRALPTSCLPDGGRARTCDCFPDGTRCRTFCGPLPTGGLDAFHLTCQGVKAQAL